MRYDQYISLIEELEKSAASDRRRYEIKVLLLTALGYGYFLGLIILFILPIPLVLVGLIMAPGEIGRIALTLGKLWWILFPALAVYFGFLGAALKAVTSKVPDPEGMELRRTEAPELFEFVDRTCSELKAKRPARVLITDSFNASVATMPRFGIFGQRVILILGLPLMKALSPEQFKAVLAHEIGHISGKHGGFAKWAYQMREAWSRLIESQEVDGHKFAALYNKFIEWYFPYFSAYSFVLMREHEKDADREAKHIVGAQPLGEALILLDTQGRRLDEDFWRSIHEENLVSNTPSERLFSRMLTSLAFVADETTVRNLSKAVAVPTDFDDTHPSLAERLRLIGYWTDGELPRIPGPITEDAASKFLAAAGGSYASQFDSLWDAQAAQTWRERHEHFQGSQKRLDELQEKRVSGGLTHEEFREMAQLLTDKAGFGEAVPLVEEAAEKFPEDALAWYNLGLARLFQESDEGLVHLEKAVELDKSLKYDASQLAFDYLRGKGRMAEAKVYASALDEHADKVKLAEKERATVLPTDEFQSHDLPADFIDTIPKKIAGLDEIRSIYVVNKVVEHFPEVPFRVLLVEMKPRVKGPDKIFNIVVERLNTGELHFFRLMDAEWKDTLPHLEQIGRVYHDPGK